MNLEEKQQEFANEIKDLGTELRKGKITMEQYKIRRGNMGKKYGFDLGSDYFNKN